MAKNYDFKNLTKVQKDCLALIESLGIYELRALARVFGDSAPTTLKRNDHINIVMNKIISGEELRPIPLRQGRPYKELSNIEGILNQLSNITGKDYSFKNGQNISSTPLQKIVVFRQYEQEIVSKKMFPLEVRGILCETPDTKELYFINQDNGRLILVKDSDKRLKPFDYITGTAVIMNEEKEYVLDTIKSINYQTISTYHEIIDEYFETMPEKTLEVDNQKIILGTRYLFKNKFLDNQEKVKSIVKCLRESKTVTLALVPNVMYENFLSIKSLGFNNSLLLKYDDKPAQIYDTLVIFLEHIKRIQQLGLNVAIFVEDLTTFANILDYAAKTTGKTLMGHSEATVELIKNLVMLAKAGINGKHTTLFTTYDESDMFDQLFVSSVYKVSKKLD